MNLDYSSILKTDRTRRNLEEGQSLLTESECDRSKVLFSPAFRRLQQQSQVFPLNGSITARSKLSHALEVAQVGRNIAQHVAAHLEQENLASAALCAALINFTETACLTRDIGSPPFGCTGEAAIQRWFADNGPANVRTACKTPSGRELNASDPRVRNALADFYEFDRNPQGLRILAKLQWGNDPRDLNLTKTSIASYIQYLRMTGEKTSDSTENLLDKPGFFSTEAGLVKNIWSSFAIDTNPQRFPLSYLVATADDIVTCISDLEEAIDGGMLRPGVAINVIKEEWLSTYIPLDPDPADEQILELLSHASVGKNNAGDDFSFADLRRGLIASLSQFAAAQYVREHQAVFSGTLDSLFPSQSGAGILVAILKNYCQTHVYQHPAVQHDELIGYTIVHGLLDQFGILLACPQEQFQLALDYSSAQNPAARSVAIESKLLALMPTQYRNAYSTLIAQLGHAHGRDEEFEEWNTRAHLVVDYIAGLTESAASAIFRTLSGIHA